MYLGLDSHLVVVGAATRGARQREGGGRGGYLTRCSRGSHCSGRSGASWSRARGAGLRARPNHAHGSCTRDTRRGRRNCWCGCHERQQRTACSSSSAAGRGEGARCRGRRRLSRSARRPSPRPDLCGLWQLRRCCCSPICLAPPGTASTTPPPHHKPTQVVIRADNGGFASSPGRKLAVLGLPPRASVAPRNCVWVRLRPDLRCSLI
jgi:hypothetical protein